MKKLLFIAFALLSLMFVSCSQEEVSPAEPSSSSEVLAMKNYSTSFLDDLGSVRLLDPASQNAYSDGSYHTPLFGNNDIDSISIISSSGPGLWTVADTYMQYKQTEKISFPEDYNDREITMCDIKIYLITGKVYTRNFNATFVKKN